MNKWLQMLLGAHLLTTNDGRLLKMLGWLLLIAAGLLSVMCNAITEPFASPEAQRAKYCKEFSRFAKRAYIDRYNGVRTREDTIRYINASAGNYKDVVESAVALVWDAAMERPAGAPKTLYDFESDGPAVTFHQQILSRCLEPAGTD